MTTQVASDRRRHKRMPIKLAGRYTLPDGSEHACETINISPGGLMMKAIACPDRGQRVVAYLRELGRVEGVATRVLIGSFAMTMVATSRKREKFASSLTWLANFKELKMVDHRRSDRIVPILSTTAITMSDGNSLAASVDDFSANGARIRTSADLVVGISVSIGARLARVLRKTDDGYALEFITQLDEQEFNPHIVF